MKRALGGLDLVLVMPGRKSGVGLGKANEREVGDLARYAVFAMSVMQIVHFQFLFKIAGEDDPYPCTR